MSVKDPTLPQLLCGDRNRNIRCHSIHYHSLHQVGLTKSCVDSLRLTLQYQLQAGFSPLTGSPRKMDAAEQGQSSAAMTVPKNSEELVTVKAAVTCTLRRGITVAVVVLVAAGVAGAIAGGVVSHSSGTSGQHASGTNI